MTAKRRTGKGKSDQRERPDPSHLPTFPPSPTRDVWATRWRGQAQQTSGDFLCRSQQRFQPMGLKPLKPGTLSLFWPLGALRTNTLYTRPCCVSRCIRKVPSLPPPSGCASRGGRQRARLAHQDGRQRTARPAALPPTPNPPGHGCQSQAAAIRSLAWAWPGQTDPQPTLSPPQPLSINRPSPATLSFYGALSFFICFPSSYSYLTKTGVQVCRCAYANVCMKGLPSQAAAIRFVTGPLACLVASLAVPCRLRVRFCFVFGRFVRKVHPSPMPSFSNGPP